MMYGLLAAIFIIDLLFIIQRNKVNDRIGLLFKMLASMNFLLLAFVCYYFKKEGNQLFALAMFIGLGFGFLGDFMLGYRKLSKRKNLTFALGLLFFLLGHFAYIAAFYQIQVVNTLHLGLLSGLIFLFAICCGYAFHFTFAYLKYFIIPYLLTVSVLVAYATLVLVGANPIGIKEVLLVVGAVLFAASDALLCFIYFKKNSNKKKGTLQLVSSICYFSTQILFAFTIYAKLNSCIFPLICL